MPRKRKTEGDRFNNPFPRHLRELMEKHNTSQQMLGDFLERSRQAIGFYCDGTAAPDIDTLAKIADYFDVSADYLLGRTDDPSRHPSAVDDLGISQISTQWIHQLGLRTGDHIDLFNYLLESEVFHYLFQDLLDYYSAATAQSIYDDLFYAAFMEDGYTVHTKSVVDRFDAAIYDAVKMKTVDFQLPEKVRFYLKNVIDLDRGNEGFQFASGDQFLGTEGLSATDIPSFRAQRKFSALLNCLGQDARKFFAPESLMEIANKFKDENQL